MKVKNIDLFTMTIVNRLKKFRKW